MKKNLVGYIVIVVVTIILAFVVYEKTETDYNKALEGHKKASHTEADLAAKKVEESLNLIYQNIRTISFLPSVKTIDRHGKNLDENARQSIQQIYNNLAGSVDVSEVYVVPKTIDGDKIDPETKQPEVPILMFDTLVVDPDKKVEEKPRDPALPVEEEIYEYRLFKKQMATLEQNFPDKSKIDGLNVPIISGEEVITCDNAEYDKTRVDADRKGILLSVPFFDEQGKFKGTISAVVRSNAIKNLMPEGSYALINKDYGYAVLSKNPKQVADSAESVKEAKPDDSLIYSEVLPISLNDPNSKWQLWVGFPDSDFFAGDDYKAVRGFEYAGYIVVALLGLVAAVVWTVIQRSFRVVQQNNSQLEAKINERVAEMERMTAEQEKQKVELEKQKKADLRKMADNFEESVRNVLNHVVSASTQMISGSESVNSIARDTKGRSEAVANATDRAAHASSQVASAAEELSHSIKEISEQTNKSTRVVEEASNKAELAKTAIDELAGKSQNVSKIIEVINHIASQINLLALNATIEAARAGEAGKGFAVVANEVKGLASQVANATQEITKNINEMQVATESSVDKVQEILRIISTVTQSTQAVAGAIEEQSAVTNEIAKNVNDVAEGTQEIGKNISSVQEGADRTGATALEVLQSARSLSSESNVLKSKVDEFLATIRKE